MHPLRQFIEQYTPLSSTDWKQINARLTRQEVCKGTLILTEGSICRYLYFLEKGLLRFFILKEGKDVTKYFTDTPYLFTSQRSFTAQQPARESIEALEDSILWRMTFADAVQLLEIDSWNTFIRKLIQEVQTFTEEILEALQTETAESRYQMMLLAQPSLVQRVPLKHLASYLGIAQQSLSRIRKNLRWADRI